MVADLVVQCLEVDRTRAGDYYILAYVKIIVKRFNLVGSDRVDHISDTMGRLAEEMIAEGSVMNRLSRNGVGIH